jgi:hypothetical protein
MYAIRNRINGQYAAPDWQHRDRITAWCGEETACAYSDPDAAQLEIDEHAVPGTCQVVEYPGMVNLTGD